MPNLPLEGSLDVFTLLHTGRPLLLIFGSTAPDLPAHWASRLDVVHAHPRVAVHDGQWSLPVVGYIPPLSAAFVLPDGYVAWVAPTSSSLDSLHGALQRWLGDASRPFAGRQGAHRDFTQPGSRYPTLRHEKSPRFSISPLQARSA